MINMYIYIYINVLNFFLEKEKGNYFISLASSQNFACDLQTAQLIQV